VKNEIYRHRIDHPWAWTSSEIGGKEGLTHRMAPEHAKAMWQLVEKTRHKAPDATTREDFDHPLVNDLMAAIRDETMNGHGCVVLSGLDLEGVSVEDYGRLYWGLGTHLGEGVAQSYRGDKIGLVQKEEHNPTGRGYLMDVELRSHTDFHEILSLASYRKSAEGGYSGLVSSGAIHNVMLEEMPHHLEALYEGYYLGGPGQGVQNKVPVFCNVGGKVSCFNQGLFFMMAARARGEELPPALTEALEALREVAARPELRADFMLEPGEIVFFHNFQVLHSRTDFKDTPEQKRLLLRLWLNVPGGRAMHPTYTEMGQRMDEQHAKGTAGVVYPQFAKSVEGAGAAPKSEGALSGQ
jgi:hypothetical protein